MTATTTLAATGPIGWLALAILGAFGATIWIFRRYYMPPEDKPPPIPAVPSPQPPPVPPTAPLPAKVPLSTFCTKLRDFEGNPGDQNYRNCNPGNFRCSPVGYLPKYGNVRCSPSNFAIFPTYALGWEYLMESVHHRTILHPTWTFYDFFANYSPSSDQNNPKHYAEVVAKGCGQLPTAILSVVLG